MAPESAGTFQLDVNGNGFSGALSADAAGIVATLFALCDLAMEEQDTPQGDALAERYHLLRDYAVGAHSEAAAIAGAID